MTDIDRILSEDEVRQYSPLALAFYGDCIYESYVRSELLHEANRPAKEMHDGAVKLVNAKYQARAVQYLIDNVFDEQELYYFKRGRNANNIAVPKSAKNSEYRAATGLEVVFGWLALTGRQERAKELYRLIRENINT